MTEEEYKEEIEKLAKSKEVSKSELIRQMLVQLLKEELK